MNAIIKVWIKFHKKNTSLMVLGKKTDIIHTFWNSVMMSLIAV